MLSATEKLLPRGKMLEFLRETSGREAKDTRTLYLPAGLSASEMQNELSQISSFPEDFPAAGEIIGKTPHGAALFWGSGGGFLVLPPFPVTEKSLTPSYHITPLLSLLTRELKIALVLVQLGSYAISICHGDKLASSKVGTGLVHGRHKKGGSSQARFRRHREKQIESFLTRVCTHIREQLEPEMNSLDYLVYGGSWTTILTLKKRCPFLTRLEIPPLPPLSNLPEPRRRVLERAINLVWSSRLIVWQEE
ncbi:Vms1/Ankzf1 family peptidyl-tRNA hydrolase [Chloroflexota bacterium]